MPKTTITVDTPIEDCGITCPYFKIDNNHMAKNRLKW